MLQVLLQMRNLKRMAADRQSRPVASLLNGSKERLLTKLAQLKTQKSQKN